jgi:hypothetical protein
MVGKQFVLVNNRERARTAGEGAAHQAFALGFRERSFKLHSFMMQIGRPGFVAKRSVVDSSSAAGVPVANTKRVRRSREPFKRATTITTSTSTSTTATTNAAAAAAVPNGRAATIFADLLIVILDTLQSVEHAPHFAEQHVAHLLQRMLLVKSRLRNQTLEQPTMQRKRKCFGLVVAHEVGVTYDVADGCQTSAMIVVQHPVDEQHEGHVVGAQRMTVVIAVRLNAALALTNCNGAHTQTELKDVFLAEVRRVVLRVLEADELHAQVGVAGGLIDWEDL